MGLYVIQGQVSGKVPFSRSQTPTMGHIACDSYYNGDCSGSNLDRASTRATSVSSRPWALTLSSRVPPDPTFANYTADPFHPDHLFTSFLYHAPDCLVHNSMLGFIKTCVYRQASFVLKSVSCALYLRTNHAEHRDRTHILMLYSPLKSVRDRQLS